MPFYLKADFPPEEFTPAKENYLFKLKWDGERPPVDAYSAIVRAIYNDYLKTNSVYGKYSNNLS